MGWAPWMPAGSVLSPSGRPTVARRGRRPRRLRFHALGIGIAAVSLSMFWLGLFQASLVLALAGLGLRAPTVSTVAFSVLAAAYAVYALLPLAGSAADLARWSPWHWALGSQPLTQGFDVRGSALLVASCALLTAVGLLTIRRRTIRTA